MYYYYIEDPAHIDHTKQFRKLVAIRTMRQISDPFDFSLRCSIRNFFVHSPPRGFVETSQFAHFFQHQQQTRSNIVCARIEHLI